MTVNPNYEPRTREAAMVAAARHAPPPSKPGLLNRFKMDIPSTKANPPNVETLTDVARDIQYYAEGTSPVPTLSTCQSEGHE